MAGKTIAKLVKAMHLRSVTNVKFSFDPYRDNVRSLREILHIVHSPKLLASNQNVNLKIDIKSDRSDPVIDIKFVDGAEMIFKTENLSTAEILDRIFLASTDKDPKKNDPKPMTTKGAKKRR